MEIFKLKFDSLFLKMNKYNLLQNRKNSNATNVSIREQDVIDELDDIILYIKNNKNKISYDEQYKFNFENSEKILKLYESIVNLSNKYYKIDINLNRKILKYKDLLITNYIQYFKFNQIFLDNVSSKFNEFCKGIFYFSSNTNVRHPVYHRTKSCGPDRRNIKYIEEELSCKNLGNTDKDNDLFIIRRNAVKNCIIERLIYNEFFIHYMPYTQNLDHLHHNMRFLRNSFESCYRSTTVSDPIISIDSNNICYKVTVIMSNPNKTITETYVKKILNINPIKYDDNVTCQRIIEDNESKVYIRDIKIQGFLSGQEDWKTIETKKLKRY